MGVWLATAGRQVVKGKRPASASCWSATEGAALERSHPARILAANLSGFDHQVAVTVLKLACLKPCHLSERGKQVAQGSWAF